MRRSSGAPKAGEMQHLARRQLLDSTSADASPTPTLDLFLPLSPVPVLILSSPFSSRISRAIDISSK